MLSLLRPEVELAPSAKRSITRLSVFHYSLVAVTSLLLSAAFFMNAPPQGVYDDGDYKWRGRIFLRKNSFASEPRADIAAMRIV